MRNRVKAVQLLSPSLDQNRRECACAHAAVSLAHQQTAGPCPSPLLLPAWEGGRASDGACVLSRRQLAAVARASLPVSAAPDSAEVLAAPVSPVQAWLTSDSGSENAVIPLAVAEATFPRVSSAYNFPRGPPPRLPGLCLPRLLAPVPSRPLAVSGEVGLPLGSWPAPSSPPFPFSTRCPLHTHPGVPLCRFSLIPWGGGGGGGTPLLS